MKYFEMKKRAFMSIVNAVKGFIRKISGTPPITLPYCVDDDSLISYSLGLEDTRKNLCKNPIHVYSYDKDYMVYNKANTVTLTPGTYTISGSRLPTLQFWDVNTKKYMKVVDVVSSYDRNSYYAVWEGRALAQTSSAVTTATFTITTPCIVTLCIQIEEISDCQIERGETATSFVPYVEPEKVGDKTKNLIGVKPVSRTINGATFTVNENGSITLNGTTTSQAVYHFNPTYNEPFRSVSVTANKSYTLSRGVELPIGVYFMIYYIDSSGAYTYVNSPKTFTPTEDVDIAFYIRWDEGITMDNVTIYPQLEEGSTATEYEPFGYKIPIKISGKNLATAKEIYSFGKQYSDFAYEELNEDGRECIRFTDNRGVYYKGVSFKENTQYTVSFDVKTTIKTTGIESSSIVFAFHYVGGTNTLLYFPRNTDWKRVQLTSEKGKTVGAIGLLSRTYSNWIYIDVNTFQLEEGATATEYEPYINPITTNIYLDEPLIAGNVLEYPKDDIPKLPTIKGTTIYSVETEVQPTNMSVEYYATRKGE